MYTGWPGRSAVAGNALVPLPSRTVPSSAISTTVTSGGKRPASSALATAIDISCVRASRATRSAGRVSCSGTYVPPSMSVASMATTTQRSRFMESITREPGAAPAAARA